jgi:hypothetical protein
MKGGTTEMLDGIGGNAVNSMNQGIVEMVDQSTAQLSATMQSMLTGAATVNISAMAYAQQAAAAVAP